MSLNTDIGAGSAERRVLLIGKLSNENFGDLLMGVYYANWVIQHGGVPVFYGAPENVKRRLSAEVACDFSDRLENADGYVCGIYFGGGYLGHSYTNALTWPQKWVAADYFGSAYRWLKINRIPYIVSSVEIGPLLGRRIRSDVAQILDDADIVIPRNIASARFASKLCPDANIVPSGDVVFQEVRRSQNRLSSKDRRVLGVHVTDKLSYRAFKRHYAAGLERAIVGNSSKIDEVKLIFDSDATTEMASAAVTLADRLRENGIECTIHAYGGIDELLQILRSLMFFVTTKLHAGVVARAYGARVLAINDQPKVGRFYQHIGEATSVISFNLSSTRRIAKKIGSMVSRTDATTPTPTDEVQHREVVSKWLVSTFQGGC